MAASPPRVTQICWLRPDSLPVVSVAETVKQCVPSSSIFTLRAEVLETAFMKTPS